MTEYHKIQTVYKRDPETFDLLEGQFSLPEFKYLKDLDWVWTEKIDGTNIRIVWDMEKEERIIHGKTDAANIPGLLNNELDKIFTKEKLKSCFQLDPEDENKNICLYGEGYGLKIRKGGNYNPDKTDFILFDCKIGDWWMSRESLEDIAQKLSIGIVPIIGIGNLIDAVEYTRMGFKSTIAHNKDYEAEGLVMKPRIELFNRAGKRIIAKIKQRDFKNKK